MARGPLVLKKIDLSLFSTSFFAKYLCVVEDGPGWGHLYHTDMFLVSYKNYTFIFLVYLFSTFLLLFLFFYIFLW